MFSIIYHPSTAASIQLCIQPPTHPTSRIPQLIAPSPQPSNAPPFTPTQPSLHSTCTSLKYTSPRTPSCQRITRSGCSIWTKPRFTREGSWRHVAPGPPPRQARALRHNDPQFSNLCSSSCSRSNSRSSISSSRAMRGRRRSSSSCSSRRSRHSRGSNKGSSMGGSMWGSMGAWRLR